MSRERTSLRGSLRVIFRHRSMIAATTAFALAATGLVLSLRRPLYESHARLVVESPGGEASAAQALEKELRILQTTRLSASDLDAAGLSGSPPVDPLRAVHDRMDVDVDDAKGAIDVGFVAHDPQLAADLTNLLVDRYLQRSAGQQDQTRLRGFYEEQVAEQDHQLDAIAGGLDEIGSGDLVDLDARKQLALAERAGLERERHEVEEHREQLLDARRRVAARLEQGGGWVETPPIAGAAPELATLDRLYYELRSERARFADAYRGDARPLRRFDRQLGELRTDKGARLVAILDARERAAKRRLESLREVEQLNHVRLAALNGHALELLRLERERSFTRSTYLRYRERAEDLRLERDLAARGFGDVSVVYRAEPVPTPISTPAGLLLSLGGLAGLLLGGALAVLRERFDHTFQEPERVREDLALPVLATIPDARDEARALTGA